MNPPSTDNPAQDTLEFSSFVSGLDTDAREVSSMRMKLRQMLASLRGDSQPIEAMPLLNRRVVSRTERDVYGQPRIVTGWEAVVHVLAWPTVIGVVLGFALAISLELAHTHASDASQQTSNRAQAVTVEATS